MWPANYSNSVEHDLRKKYLRASIRDCCTEFKAVSTCYSSCIICFIDADVTFAAENDSAIDLASVRPSGLQPGEEQQQQEQLQREAREQAEQPVVAATVHTEDRGDGLNHGQDLSCASSPQPIRSSVSYLKV